MISEINSDAPKGQEDWTPVSTGFSYASDLVRYIRLKYDDYFCISVAGYVEGHPETPDEDENLQYLKDKVDAGTTFNSFRRRLHCYPVLL